MSTIRRYGLLILAIFFLGFLQDVDAQCAMCKAVAEQGVDENGYGVAAGLNSGIIFLMGIPYVLLAILVLVFFRKRFMGFWKSFNNIHSH